MASLHISRCLRPLAGKDYSGHPAQRVEDRDVRNKVNWYKLSLHGIAQVSLYRVDLIHKHGRLRNRLPRKGT